MKKNEKEIKPACRSCRGKPCEGLYWKDFLVFPDIFAVPFDYPLRVEDESKFKWELQSLSDYDVSRIAGDVWVKHNFGARYGNGKQDEIEHILSHFRQSKCIMIAKSADPWYKPWSLFGRWAHSGGGFDFQLKSFKKEEEEEFLTDSMADEASAQQAPLKITSISWRHTDSALQKDSADIAHSGDTIEFHAEFENYVEGAGVDFFVYGNVNDTKKQFTKVHTRCKNMAATAEWLVDISKCDADNPGIEFDCEARDKKSNRKHIDIELERRGGFCIHIKNQSNDIIAGATITITADASELFNGELSDGILEMNDVPDSELSLKCECDGQTIEQPIRLEYGPPPYMTQVITVEIGIENQER